MILDYWIFLVDINDYIVKIHYKVSTTKMCVKMSVPDPIIYTYTIIIYTTYKNWGESLTDESKVHTHFTIKAIKPWKIE